MHWLLLLLAIGSEIVATSALKETQGFTRLLPSLLCIGGYALAFYLLSVVVKYVPVGIAYALWSGIGVVIVSLVGWFFFHQKLDLPAMIGLGLIVAGVAVMHLFSKSMELGRRGRQETSCRPFFSRRRTLSRDTGPRQTGRHPSAVPAFPEQRAHVKEELLRRSLPLRQAAGPSSAARIPPAGGRHPPGCRVWPAPRLSSRKGRGGASRQARCRGRSLRG